MTMKTALLALGGMEEIERQGVIYLYINYGRYSTDYFLQINDKEIYFTDHSIDFKHSERIG